ncbi:hypothetical protein F2P81_002908 [Scophthalmus maximus]|uniref:Uncharacterized protein n=1 Tax=Scophthalmus maximus TaxID=52904 RepID=A0A6A4TJ71_SCOMX|nr:hypothetical protein F2P81_002908 [Scophthalmus maximus]
MDHLYDADVQGGGASDCRCVHSQVFVLWDTPTELRPAAAPNQSHQYNYSVNLSSVITNNTNVNSIVINTNTDGCIRPDHSASWKM